MGFIQGRNTEAAGHRSHWLLPCAIALIACLIALGHDSARLHLRYDRLAVESGELWRLASGHFTHLSAAHLGLNLAGLFLVWALTGSRLSSAHWIAVIILILTVMNLGFWFLDLHLLWYVGLSGLLHGLLATGSVVGLRRRDGESVLILLLLLGKIVYEQVFGPLPGSELTSGGPVVVNAHLYGALAGLLAGTTLWHRVGEQRHI